MPVCQRGFACGETARAVIGPAFLGLPRKIRRGISLRETTLCGCPLRSHDFVTPHRCFSLPRFRSAQSQPHGPSQHPGACRRSAPFRCAKPRWPVVAPPGQRARYPIFASLKCGPAYSRGVCRGMEFEIQFFSVAERPLTFFAYFLNAKKVGRRRLVISPAKAGPSSFPTCGFRSRPALAPVRSHFTCGETGLASYRPHLLGLPRKKRARHFAARNHPVRLSASRPWLRHPAPLFCRSRHGCAAPGPQRQKPGALWLLS